MKACTCYIDCNILGLIIYHSSSTDCSAYVVEATGEAQGKTMRKTVNIVPFITIMIKILLGKFIGKFIASS